MVFEKCRFGSTYRTSAFTEEAKVALTLGCAFSGNPMICGQRSAFPTHWNGAETRKKTAMHASIED